MGESSMYLGRLDILRHMMSRFHNLKDYLDDVSKAGEAYSC